MKRDATQVIWRTVVFAGAMLGAQACHSKKAPTTPPTNNTTTTPTTDAATPSNTDTTATNPTNAPATDTADPCMGGDERPRGTDDDGGGGVGRGFVLS
jgi:hypothetical protein